MTELLQTFIVGILTGINNVLPNIAIPTQYLDAFTNGIWALYQFDKIFPIPEVSTMIGGLVFIIAFEFTTILVRFALSVASWLRGSGQLKFDI